MSLSVSTSGVGRGRMGNGLSVRFSCASLLKQAQTRVTFVICDLETVRVSKSHTPGHLLYAVSSVVFIMHVARHIFQVVHVRANQHVSQLHKVTVRLILH